MQAYEPLQAIQIILKTKKEKIYYQKLKAFINSKVKILLKSRSQNEAYFYKWTFWKRKNNFIKSNNKKK